MFASEREHSLVVTTLPDVLVSVYDASGHVAARAEGSCSFDLPDGLYRVRLERERGIEEHLLDHHASSRVQSDGPALRTPAPVVEAGASRGLAQVAGEVDRAPLAGVGVGRIVFVQRCLFAAGILHPTSRQEVIKRVTVHDATGREVDPLAIEATACDRDRGTFAFRADLPPGMYRLRARGPRARDISVPVLDGRTSFVFVSNDGVPRLDDARIALLPHDAGFDAASSHLLAAESALAALSDASRSLPACARSLLPGRAAHDPCFGLVCAHVLLRSQERGLLDETLKAVAGVAGELVDVAVLRLLARAPQDRSGAIQLSEPPLLRATLSAVTTSEVAKHIEVVPRSGLAEAARRSWADSPWCCWSPRIWDEAWIGPTVDALVQQGSTHRARSEDLARTLALPSHVVDGTLRTLRASTIAAPDGAEVVPVVADGDYVVGDRIGRGGYGSVYRATRSSDGQDVALKIVPVSSGEDAQHVVRAQRELALARLEHPNLVRFIDSGVLAGGIWIATELCRGSVWDRMAELGGALSPAEAVSRALQALDGLAYLHARGVVHRDLTPRNLLIDAAGTTKIADLGLAKDLVGDRAVTRTGQALGTVRFAPPEQLLDAKRVTPAADVWSLAATLYFMITAELPRDEYADQDDIDAALENPVVPIGERDPALPGALAACIDRALSPEPGARPQDASELRTQLRAAWR